MDGNLYMLGRLFSWLGHQMCAEDWKKQLTEQPVPLILTPELRSKIECKPIGIEHKNATTQTDDTAEKSLNDTAERSLNDRREKSSNDRREKMPDDRDKNLSDKDKKKMPDKDKKNLPNDTDEKMPDDTKDKSLQQERPRMSTRVNKNDRRKEDDKKEDDKKNKTITVGKKKPPPVSPPPNHPSIGKKGRGKCPQKGTVHTCAPSEEECEESVWEQDWVSDDEKDEEYHPLGTQQKPITISDDEDTSKEWDKAEEAPAGDGEQKLSLPLLNVTNSIGNRVREGRRMKTPEQLIAFVPRRSIERPIPPLKLHFNPTDPNSMYVCWNIDAEWEACFTDIFKLQKIASRALTVQLVAELLAASRQLQADMDKLLKTFMELMNIPEHDRAKQLVNHLVARVRKYFKWWNTDAITYFTHTFKLNTSRAIRAFSDLLNQLGNLDEKDSVKYASVITKAVQPAPVQTPRLANMFILFFYRDYESLVDAMKRLPPEPRLDIIRQ